MKPSTLYHATTPKKHARYVSTGAILPPVRGFTTIEAAQEWAKQTGRTVICRVTPEHADDVHKLPDHHNQFGLAFWYDRPAKFETL